MFIKLTSKTGVTHLTNVKHISDMQENKIDGSTYIKLVGDERYGQFTQKFSELETRFRAMWQIMK